MHKKSFFQGLGLGLIIASVLFLILYATKSREDKPSEPVQTAEAEANTESTTSLLDLPDGAEGDREPIGEVGEIEGEVGEPEVPPEPVMEELEPIDGVVSDISGIESGDMSVPSLTENVGSVAEASGAEAGVGEASGGEASAAEPQEPETVRVSIKSGDRASEICHKLYVAGAIDDEKGFADFMRNNGYSRKVLYGNFDIPKGASYREVYDIIKSH